MFLDKLNQPADHTEGVYDKNKPEEIEKYLFKAALRFAGIVAEVRVWMASSIKQP